MLKKLTFLLFALFFCAASFAQTTTTDYHNRLYYLGKVWGYAKYFHPSVANCTVNWDEVLLETVPKVKSAPSDEDFNEILRTMIRDLGIVPEATTPKVTLVEAVSYNLDISWFEDDIFDDQVKSLLQQIEEEFRPQNHCLVSQAFQSGNPTFDTDARYHSSLGNYPDEATRVLAIFRYWNIINYFFPYKYVMDQDWDATLRQFIPPIVNATDELDYHLSMKKMTTYINDTHAFFRSNVYAEWLGYFFLPFFVNHIEDQTVITKIHSSAVDQLAVGDVVLSVNGVAVDSIRDHLHPYMAASNVSALERNINSALIRGEQGEVQLKLQNKEGTRTVTVTRKSFRDYETLFSESGSHYQFKTGEGGCRMGYVNMGLLEPEEVDFMMSGMRSMDAIIFDIRNYPNGTLWTLIDYLYARPINFVAFTNPSITHPGRLDFYQYSLGSGGAQYPGKLIILFNEDTQSQAEFTVMGLEMHPGAIKIGSQTAGADGNVTYVKLPGNIETVFTGLGVFYPDGTETQRIGIVPDIELKPTIAGIRAGRDEILEYALNCDLIDFDAPLVVSEDGFDVFPNPTNDVLNIRSIREEAYIVRVLDVLGRTLQTLHIETATPDFQLDLTNYPSGIYIVTFETADEVFLSKQVMKN
ncbi:MAG: S41 family peptidase [Bacteroidota bacterium]